MESVIKIGRFLTFNLLKTVPHETSLLLFYSVGFRSIWI